MRRYGLILLALAAALFTWAQNPSPTKVEPGRATSASPFSIRIKIRPPLVNASRKPGEWQTYDIVFEAPQFDSAKLLKAAYLTVFHNRHHGPQP